MKKRLLCLPLAAVMMSGCTVMGINLDPLGLVDKTKELIGLGGTTTGGEKPSGTNTKPSGDGGSGGGGGGGGGTITVGTKVATLDLQSDHTTTKTNDLVVIENGGATLTITKGSSTSNCGGEDNKYVAKPVRIYSGQHVKIELNKSFSKMVFDCPVYAGSDNFAEYMKEVIESGSYASAVEVSNTKVTVDVGSSVTSWEYTVDQISAGYKQNRYYSVEFYA